MSRSQKYKLRLFGGFHLSNGNDEAIMLRARKSKALLAWLAVNPDQAHQREKLAALLWPDSDETQARHSLRQALGGLRKIMPDNDSPIESTKDWIMLDSKLIEVDALRFEQLTTSSPGIPSDISPDIAPNNASLDEAIILYKGDFLEGCNPHTDLFEEWLEGYRNSYRERAAAIMSRRLETLDIDKDYETVITVAMRLIAVDPLREAAYRALMKAHSGLGHPAVALRWYRRCRRILQQELGVEPEAATQTLYEKLLSAWENAELSASSESSISESVNASRACNIRPGINATIQQRIIYQIETAIEGILDHIGGQSFLIRSEADSGKAELIAKINQLAESHGFTVCHGKMQSQDADSVDPDNFQLSKKLSSCLLGTSQCCKPDDHIPELAKTIELASETSPVLLLIEDIHHANHNTLTQLAQLISSVGDSASLLLMTSRREGEPLDPVWRGAMRGAPLTTIDLD